MSESLILSIAAVVGVILFILVFLSMLNRFLVKAEAGQALVKTGFGLSKPGVYLSSVISIPLLHRTERIDLTVKTVRTVRRAHESLSCADGIRAEVEVDFYIKINPVEEDIRHVASTIGCGRASDIGILRELFEAKFADALKTAGAALSFDQLYQNRREFRDEIMKALGQDAENGVILNGYRLDDVAIQYLEQLPLEMHNENNVLDARGRKEIAQRTSAEVEAANKRLREKEVTIATQNREAKLKQLQIEQDIAAKQALQTREIAEAQAREQATMQQTVAEQEKLSEQARIIKDREIKATEIERQKAIEVADEERKRNVESARIVREKAIQIAEQEKLQQIEIARIEREKAESEALKAKLSVLEEVAKQEALKLKAEEQAQTVKSLEIANRQKAIEIIEAEKAAAVEKEKQKVESDVRAYEITTVAKAKLDAAEMESQAAEKQAKAIETVGLAQAATTRANLDAQNVINSQAILAQALKELMPQLPILVEKLMIPAEKIESIRVLNVHGLQGQQDSGDGASSSVAGSIIGTVLQAGMVLPVIKELMGAIRSDGGQNALSQLIEQVPGLSSLIEDKNEPA
ncbi:MAG: hypothetical protein JNN12_12635 [Bacteroidetes Order II. Incertae sedis bacterium]|nr:hypothetical protein [Bacteroidetes Order II. bacterium]